jgi:hypothetical protein
MKINKNQNIYYTELKLYESNRTELTEEKHQALYTNEYFVVINDFKFTTLSKNQNNYGKITLENININKIIINCTEFDNYIYGILYTLIDNKENNFYKIKEKMIEYIIEYMNELKTFNQKILKELYYTNKIMEN